VSTIANITMLVYNVSMFKNDVFESIIDVGSGFLLAVLIQMFIFPLFGLYPSIFDSMGIAIIFTVVSMTRSALWRRYFRRRNSGLRFLSEKKISRKN